MLEAILFACFFFYARADIFLPEDVDFLKLSFADKQSYFDQCTPVSKLLTLYGVETSVMQRMLIGTEGIPGTCISDEQIQEDGEMMMLKLTDPTRFAQYLQANKGLEEAMAWMGDLYNNTLDWVHTVAIPVATRSMNELRTLAYDLAEASLSAANAAARLFARLADKLSSTAYKCIMTPPCQKMMLSAATWTINQGCMFSTSSLAVVGCSFVKSALLDGKGSVWIANDSAADGAFDQDKAVFHESGHRYALVVGNNAYPDTPLRMAVNDARAIGDALKVFGFSVTALYDISYVSMAERMEWYRKNLRDGDVFFFYFSGHGSQNRGHHKLALVDGSSIDLEDKLIRSLNHVQARTMNIVMMDACRADSQELTWKTTWEEQPRSYEKGILGRSEAAEKMSKGSFYPVDQHGKEWLLSFSSDPGTVSLEYPTDENGFPMAQ